MIIRYLLPILFTCLYLSCNSQNKPTDIPNGYREGFILKYIQHYECRDDVICNAKDSSYFLQHPPEKWTVYVRGDQMRLEFPSDHWNYNGDGIKVYPGKNDLNSFACFTTKYINYYTMIDSTMDQLRIIEDYRRRKWMELLPDTLTISGFKCKAAIYHDGYQNWHIYYTDDIPKISTPHKLKLWHEYRLIQHVDVPHLIVQQRPYREPYNVMDRTIKVETLVSIERLPLHDSLFQPSSNYVKYESWSDAREEHMKRWNQDLANQHALNPVTQAEKDIFHGHWIHEDDYGIYHLDIQPAPKPGSADTCFVRDFMFRKNERSSGTIGNWKTYMMGRRLFHEFSRSWTHNKEKDELVHFSNNNWTYRRASKEEAKIAMRECDLVWAAWDMADSLEKWGYDKVIVQNKGRLADSLWNMQDGEEIIRRVAYRTGSRRNERFIAAEIVFRKDPNYPPKDDQQLLKDLSHAYGSALSNDYAPFGDYWGNPKKGTIGICGKHLLRIGDLTIPELTRLVLNQEFDFYMDYDTKWKGQYTPRKKDHAAFFLNHMINEPYVYKSSRDERNADIELLNEKLKSR